jgi:hypothetical protein
MTPFICVCRLAMPETGEIIATDTMHAGVPSILFRIVGTTKSMRRAIASGIMDEEVIATGMACLTEWIAIEMVTAFRIVKIDARIMRGAIDSDVGEADLDVDVVHALQHPHPCHAQRFTARVWAIALACHGYSLMPHPRPSATTSSTM